jgi:hypothetical protein
MHCLVETLETVVSFSLATCEVQLSCKRVFPVGTQLSRGIAFAALVDQHLDDDLGNETGKQKHDHQLNNRKALHALHIVSLEMRWIQRASWYAKPGCRRKPAEPGARLSQQEQGIVILPLLFMGCGNISAAIYSSRLLQLSPSWI